MLARSNTATLDVPQTPARQVIRAELIGSDICTAAGTTVELSTPVLGLCRKLIAAGHGPGSQLDIYRGETLALRLRSIGAAAALEINGEGTGFRLRRAPATAPPMRQTDGGGKSGADHD